MKYFNLIPFECYKKRIYYFCVLKLDVDGLSSKEFSLRSGKKDASSKLLWLGQLLRTMGYMEYMSSVSKLTNFSQGDVASEGAWIGISMSDRSDNLNNSSEGCTCS